MRVVIAKCSATYAGRGNTYLEPAVRAIIIKGDGAISIHSDYSNKALNYMGAGCSHFEITLSGKIVWVFENRKENLQITFDEIISDTNISLSETEPGLIKDGTEAHLQAYLAENPHALGDRWTFVAREYATGAGPVDLLMKDASGAFIAVEVKRVAMLGSVDQVRRYVEALNAEQQFDIPVRGVIAALDVRPNTTKLADKRGIECIIVKITDAPQ